MKIRISVITVAAAETIRARNAREADVLEALGKIERGEAMRVELLAQADGGADPGIESSIIRVERGDRFPTDLRAIARRVYETSASKGFHDSGPHAMGDLAALLHTEVSEFYEEHRAGRQPGEVYHVGTITKDRIPYLPGADGLALAEAGIKPEGIGVELADLLIRILDTAEEMGIDIAYLVQLKDTFNRTRPHKHGKVC